MSTNKPHKNKKQTARTTAQTRRSVDGGVLNQLAPGEVATVFRVLLEKHPNLVHEAEEIAAGVVSSPSVEGIADDVCTSVTTLDMDDLNGRAGAHSWGYVEPSEAAQELLEEAVAVHFDDMKRRLNLGLEAAAEAVCAGIVLGYPALAARDPAARSVGSGFPHRSCRLCDRGVPCQMPHRKAS